MRINHSKSNVVVFRRTQLRLPAGVHDYSIHSTPIATVSSYKYLGLTLHEHLQLGRACRRRALQSALRCGSHYPHYYPAEPPASYASN